MLAEVVASFARHAPARLRLVIKMHPLDNALEDWARIARREARRRGVADRVRVMDGGPLDTLIEHAQGVLCVNSTVGLTALRVRRPVCALGAAIYDMPGLTHQGPLSRFWTAPEGPEAELVEAFVAALAATLQVRGSFYNPRGRRAAAREIAARVGEGRVNGHGAWVPEPPRLPVRRRAADR
jgi:capsular polysaccharide export protein